MYIYRERKERGTEKQIDVERERETHVGVYTSKLKPHF